MSDDDKCEMHDTFLIQSGRISFCPWCKWNEAVEVRADLAVAKSELAALTRKLAERDHEHGQLKEAYDAISEGKPLGPVVSHQVIINLGREVASLTARLAEREAEIARLTALTDTLALWSRGIGGAVE